MIWCIGFTTPYWHHQVRGISIELESDSPTAHNARVAEAKAKDIAKELGWPEDVVISWVIPVFRHSPVELGN